MTELWTGASDDVLFFLLLFLVLVAVILIVFVFVFIVVIVIVIIFVIRHFLSKSLEAFLLLLAFLRIK